METILVAGAIASAIVSVSFAIARPLKAMKSMMTWLEKFR